MTDKPFVSVIIIFLNAEAFIKEAIESIFAQSYPAWELLLVDDGSTDRSTEIAQTYAAQYPSQVRYLEHPGHRNQGKGASRNLGLRQAAGKYVAFLDADDLYLPQQLEQQVAILEKLPSAAMVYGSTLYCYSWTGKDEDRQRDYRYEPGVSPNTLIAPPGLFTNFFLRQTAAIPGTCSILIRRQIIDEIGGYEEHFLGINNIYEDQTFYAKICLHAPIFVTDQTWGIYRQHSDSSCSTAAEAGQENTARIYFLNWLAEYLSECKVSDPEIWRELRHQIWRYQHPALEGLVARGQQIIHKPFNLVLSVSRHLIPAPIRGRIWTGLLRQDTIPQTERVRFGSLRRTTPISQDWGFDRGLPVDRYYIENFLTAHNKDIRGCVLEIMDDSYTRRFGGEKVTHSDVLSMESSPKATILGDLTCADHIPSNAYDCVILTQTIQLIYDVRAGLRTVYRILKPGGVLLLTAPGISQISRYDADRWGDCWRFTTRSARQLLEELFPAGDVHVSSHGNVLVATALLYGLATSELHQNELDHHDPDYQVLITARAVKPSSNQWGE